MGTFVSGRVTSSMLSNNYLSGMNKNLSNLQKINNQLTSGKEISRPSDNPYKVARSMQLYSNIDANKQYNENIKDTQNWLDSTDTALGQVTSVLQRVRELMVSAGNAAYGTKERTSIQNEVNERIGELGQILNTNFDGRYIFGGTKVTSKPVYVDKGDDGTTLSYCDANGNSVSYGSLTDTLKNQLGANVTTEISQGVTIDYNVTASSLLNFSTGKYVLDDGSGNVYKNGDGSVVYVDKLGNPLDGSTKPDGCSAKAETIDAMDLFKGIVEKLDDEDTGDLTTTKLSDFDKVVDNLLKIRSEVGANQNRMESAKSQNEDSNYNMTDILSKTEDIDWTEKTIQYYMAKTVYQASLQVSAQVLPQTLLDYI